jgi:hypothetical protein
MDREYVRGTINSLANIIASLYIIIGLPIFSILLVIQMFSSSDTEEVRVSEAKVTTQPQFVKVSYQVQYGSIYTGDQTPLIYCGEQKLPIVDGLGPNGLPIAGYFPTHANLPLALYGGRDATLHVPCMSADSVVSFLDIPGARYPIYLSARVRKGSDGTVFIRATPA